MTYTTGERTSNNKAFRQVYLFLAKSAFHNGNRIWENRFYVDELTLLKSILKS